MISIRDSDFKKLTTYFHHNYGINLTGKRTLIESRLGNMIIERGFRSFSEYLTYAFIDENNDEMVNLINKLTTNHTYFMRESNHFEFFKDKVLPFWVSNLKLRDLRIWSAGCSSGEEAYTIAMIVNDYLGEDKSRWDSRILATDISSKVLELAIDGVYGQESIDKLPNLYKIKYLTKVSNDSFVMNDEIKKEIIFRKFNLMEEVFPFRKKFHVIFCRNVMIYFDAKTKIELVNKFYNLLETGGYLFIGHSESINREETQFKYVMPAVYRKG